MYNDFESTRSLHICLMNLTLKKRNIVYDIHTYTMYIADSNSAISFDKGKQILVSLYPLSYFKWCIGKNVPSKPLDAGFPLVMGTS